MKHLCLIALSVALTLFALPVTAEAGSYRVNSCRTAAGAPAPTDGWRAYRSTYQSWTADGCADGGGLYAALDGSKSHDANLALVGWSFDSGGRDVLAWNIDLRTDNAGTWFNTTADVWVARSERNYTGENLVYRCVAHLGCVGPKTHSVGETKAPPSMRQLHVTAMCGGLTGYQCTPVAGRTASEFTLRRATLTLADDVAPVAENIGGEHGLAFTAVDPAPGSGVRRVSLEVDGNVVRSFVPDDNNGRCVPDGQDFVAVQPCLSRVAVDLPFNAGEFTPGSHVLRVRVADAAGNVATVVGPTRFEVAGGEVTIHADGAAEKPERRVLLRALKQRIKPYGRMLLRGSLRASLSRGALVEIQLRSGRGWRTIAVRRTNKSGDFRFRHRFRRTSKAVLAFRARVRPDADLPVRALPSRTVRVRVG